MGNGWIRFGYIDRHQTGNTRILLATVFIWYSGFLPFHEHMVEINGNMHFREGDFDESFIRHDVGQSKLLEEDQFDCPKTSSKEHPHLSLTFGQYWINLFKFIEAPYVKYLYNLVSLFFNSRSSEYLCSLSIPM